MNIAIDGFALGLRQGTGLSTYAHELAGTLAASGNELSILYGLNGLGMAPDLLWPRFVQSLSTRGESSASDWQCWGPWVALYLGHHVLRRPLSARRIPHSADSVGHAVPGRFPRAAALFNIPSVYRAAQAYSSVLPVPLLVKRLPGVQVFHQTSPLPVRMAGVANVVTAHDAIPLTLPYSTEINLRHYRRLMETALKPADQIFVVSEHSKRDLLSLFDLPEERVHVTYQAVNIPAALRQPDDGQTARFLKANFNLQEGGYFLFHGAIEPKKNVMRLLDAHAMTRSELPLVLVGKNGWLHGDESRRIAAMLADRRSARRLRRIDYLPYPQLMMLLKGARALVFPSLYEGFGLPVLEAMQMGVPVITSNTTSLPEVTGDAAHLVNPRDIGELAAAMDRLAEDDVWRAELVRKGLARVEHFSPARHLERLEAGYRRALG